MPRLREGSTVGGWRLITLLGEGGNAEVWRAQRDGTVAALKVLHQRRAESEAYRRFQREIDALRQIGNVSGVLPMFDSNLPAKPTDGDPPWIAFPIAEPLADHLRAGTLVEIVAAMRALAEALASLHTRFELHHRDVKPSNTYWHEGAPALGDFGLVEFPGAQDITPPGGFVGPRHFLADEMISDASEADGGPADVFSLAKTLWVLATDQRWPPQGEQSASNASMSIGRFRPHPLVADLDRLIERCTRHDPNERPSMAQSPPI